ncbi:Dabb family protein [Maribellus comscasis]|uniref:Dabb family protein n=1 Tax=Maribellus comscasis TaxID=2681766 RepID=A0A6I6JMQ6_9BACT|nr:Dabb family protein [Maribellus comscasis]QGY42348.1 Dabb family protein [Maribellus comscasis]
MINHVVLFKLNDYSKQEKQAVIAELKSALEGLKGKIEEVKYLEVGVNYELEAKSYDLVLISHFESLEDLDVYRVHPEHLKVVKRIGETTSARAAVDYEF